MLGLGLQTFGQSWAPKFYTYYIYNNLLMDLCDVFHYIFLTSSLAMGKVVAVAVSLTEYE